MQTLFTSCYRHIVMLILPFLIFQTPGISQCVPLTPGPVSGITNVCNYINTGDLLTYSVDPLPDALSYQWTVPPTVTLVSGQGTNSIQVVINNGFIASPNKQIRVRATFDCGTSDLRILYLNARFPSTPGAITGPTNACPFVIAGTTATYFIHPIRGTLSYNWIAPAGMTLDHPNPAGINDTIVIASFDNNFSTSNLLVQAVNNCGTSASRSFKIYRSAAITPGPISGVVNVCPYINTGDQLTYSVAPIPGATSFIWVVPPSLTILSGQGTSSIVVTVGPDFIATANKLIKVSAEFNNCGIGGERLLYLKAQLPSTPKRIEGPSDACPFIGSGDEATYFIHPVAGALSYNWEVQAGATISHPNGPGMNDTLVTVTFSNAFTSSPITVQAINNCAPGTVRSLNILRNPQATPGPISGPVNVCPNVSPNGTEATYSINPATNATSYDWSAPAGSIVTHLNVPGPDDRSITVLFPQGFVSGQITVTATGGCGTSALRTLNVVANKPGTPGPITAAETSSCPNRRITYSIPSFPLNATSVLWTVPTGATIFSGNGLASIEVDYPSDAVNGVVTVYATGNCSNSAVRSLAVDLPACRPVLFSRNAMADRKITPVIELNEKPGVFIYPNPVVHETNVRYITTRTGKILVRVLDMSGAELKRFNINPNSTTAFGAGLSSGMYLVEITQGSSRSVQKLIKL